MKTTDSLLPPKFAGVLDSGENVIWISKPHILPFMLTGAAFLAVGLVWGALDWYLLLSVFNDKGLTRGFC